MSDFYHGKNVLVTGAAGLTGHAMVNNLLEQGANVRATVFKNRKLDIYHPKLEWGRYDLMDFHDCMSASKDMDVVFNCVAFIRGAGGQMAQPVEIVHNNLLPTLNMMEAANNCGVDRFGFLSSSTVYPDVDYPVKENDGLVGNPAMCYYGVGWMKRYCETLCNFFHQNSTTNYSIVRTTALYGPYDNFHPQQGHVIPSLIMKAFRQDNPFEIWGDGSQTRDFVYVDDLAKAFMKVVETINLPEPINIATGQGVTINEIVQVLLELSNYGPELTFNTSKPTMIAKRLVCVDKAHKLNIRCNTTIRDGLAKTFQWYKTVQNGQSR